MQGHQFTVRQDEEGLRIDRFLAVRLPGVSRSVIQAHIGQRAVLVDGVATASDRRLKAEAEVMYQPPEPVPADLVPENLPLEILFEDAELLVLNKQAGLVVHPAAGHASGTLVNALLHHCCDLAGIGGTLRPGIVHRLDKDTTGLMVVAKTQSAMTGLASAFKDGRVEKQYVALVRGVPVPASGVLDTLIGRSPRDRKKMAVTRRSGRQASTSYTVREHYDGRYALLDVCIHTGRTHQIRVHLAHLGCPVLGDPQYGRDNRKVCSPDGSAWSLSRQMLHAARLAFPHPASGDMMRFEAAPPEDFVCAQAFINRYYPAVT